MALKLVVSKEEYDGLEEAVKKLYVEKDGEFTLDAEVEDVSGLKSALDKERSNVKKLKTDLQATVEKFKDIDPEKAREAQLKLQEIEDQKMMSEGKAEELFAKRTERMKADHQNQVDEFNKQIEGLKKENASDKRRLSELLIDGSLRQAALKAGVHDSAVDDVVLRGRRVWKLVDNVPTPLNGENIIYGKDANKAVEMVEWVTGLQTDAPHLFKPTGGSGAPGSSSQSTAKNIVLTREQARDPQIYRNAKAQAEKTGASVTISD
jgi:hypothetical protein